MYTHFFYLLLNFSSFRFGSVYFYSFAFLVNFCKYITIKSTDHKQRQPMRDHSRPTVYITMIHWATYCCKKNPAQ